MEELLGNDYKVFDIYEFVGAVCAQVRCPGDAEVGYFQFLGLQRIGHGWDIGCSLFGGQLS